jgi:quinol monooxygenase YgiN
VSEQIGWCVELAIQPGQFDSFIELTREMVAETAAEPGVLAYQRFISNDGQIVHAVERYESSDAALGHLRTFQQQFAERFSSMVTRRRFSVYGTPSAELKAMLDGFGAIYFSRLGDLGYCP